MLCKMLNQISSEISNTIVVGNTHETSQSACVHCVHKQSCFRGCKTHYKGLKVIKKCWKNHLFMYQGKKNQI